MTIRVSDRAAAQRFYATVRGALGVAVSADAGYAEWDDFSLIEADAEHPVTQRLHIGFAARARAEVDAFWRAAAKAGAPHEESLGGRPRRPVRPSPPRGRPAAFGAPHSSAGAPGTRYSGVHGEGVPFGPASPGMSPCVYQFARYGRPS